MGNKRQLNSKRHTRRVTASRRKKRQNQFETLEARQLLAVDFVPSPLSVNALNRPDQPLGLSDPSTQPSIALNSRDPGVLAVTNGLDLVQTTNAGTTFNPSGNFQALVGSSSTAVGGSDLVYTSEGELRWASLKTDAAGTRSIGVTFSDTNVFGVTNVPIASGGLATRPVIAADKNQAGDSPYSGFLYVSFTDETTNRVLLSRSEDNGRTWSTPVQVSDDSETTSGTFAPVTPASVAVGPNGDVYVAYHYQSGSTAISGADNQSNSDGTSGQVFVRRSIDGGLSFSSKTNAFGPGEADISLNVQTAEGAIDRARFSTLGARQPTILADPTREGHIYVIANDDPDNVHGSGDEGDIVFSRSTDFGATWDVRTIDDPTGFQVLPQAEIDQFGNFVIVWYDSREGNLMGNRDYRLDVFATYSVDGGSTFVDAFQINDRNNPIDPVTPNTAIVFPGADRDTDGRPENDGDETYSLGNWFDVEIFGGTFYVAWNGNERVIGLPSAHQVYFQALPVFGTLHVTGLDTADTFQVRSMPDNPLFIEVWVNGEREYTGLREALLGGIEFDGLAGNDTLIVDFETGAGTPVPFGGIFFQGNIPEGGNQIGDTLNLLTDGRSLDFQAEPSDLDAGLFVVGGSSTISFDSVERIQTTSTNYLRPDRLEVNDEFGTATNLGSSITNAIRELTIHDVGEGQSNDDFYQITAFQTGMLLVNVPFDHAEGDLDLQILDSRGNVVGSSSASSDEVGAESLEFPVVAGETYTLRVFGVDGAINSYSLLTANVLAPAPQTVVLNSSSDSGAMPNDSLTSDIDPTFTIQADLTSLIGQGITVLTAEQATAGVTPGAALFVMIRDSNGGTIESGYATSLGDNLFQFESGALADGFYLASAAVHVFDVRQFSDGTTTETDPVVGPSVESGSIEFTIDTAASNITSPQVLPSSDSGMQRDDNVTNVMQPAFVGIAGPNDKVRIFANGLIVGEGVAGPDGRWEITIEPLTDGIYDITGTATDMAGNVAENNQVNRIEIDTRAPNTPFLDLVDASDTGLSNIDNVTGDNTPTFTMTTTDPGEDHLDPFNYKFRIYVRPEGGGEMLVFDSVTADSIPDEFRQDGFTSLEFLTTTLTELPDGSHNFKLEVEDRAGNISEDFLLGVEINTAIPGSLTIDLLTASDTGMSDDDNVTSFSRPSFVGSGPVGGAVTLFASGVVVGRGTVGGDATFGDPDDGLGAWEITSSSLDDGTYSLTALVETNAGVTSTEPITVEIDTLPPNKPALDLTAATDTGHDNDDNITSALQPAFHFTTQDPNQASHANQLNYKYRLFVRPESGEEMLVYNSVGDAAIAGDATDGVFTSLQSLTSVVEGLPAGTHNFKLEVEDRAGNISPATTLDVEIDRSIDGNSDFALLFSSDSGMDDRDNVTNINQPTFTGLAEVGAEVTLVANGDIVGTTVVTPDPDSPADALGEWSVTSAPLADGIYDIQVRVEDWAGNALQTDTVQIEVDTEAPNTPFLDLDIASDDGDSGTDNMTTRRTLTLNMTTTDPGRPAHLIDENFKFRLYQRTGTEAEALVYDSFADLGDFTGLESLQTTLTDFEIGAYNFKLEVEDRAGNISPDALLDVIVGEVVVVEPEPDIQVPTTIELVAASDAGMDPADGVTRIIAPTFAGLGEADGIVQLFANGELVGTGIVGGDRTDGVADDGLGLWQVNSGDLDDGTYTVVAVVQDGAGNLTSSESVVVEIDTLAPNTPYLDLLPADDTGLSNQDDVTSNLQPTFHMATLDPNQSAHITPFNYKYRLYVRLDSGIERLVYDSSVDDMFPGSVVQDGFTSLENLRRQIDLGVPDGVHDFKLEVEDRAGNISEDFLLGITIDTDLAGPDGGLTLDMLNSSDTGMSSRDDVTRIDRPAFGGVAEVGATVTILANGQVVGVGTVGSDETDLVPGNGLGAWEVTVEPLADGTYEMLAHVEDTAGNFGRPEPISIEIDTTAPNTPFLDLLNDTGHSTSDNITQDSELRFNLTTEDPDLPGGRANAFNYKYRIYQRLEGGAESLIYNSVTDANIDAEAISEGFTNLEQLEALLGPFPNGVHNFKLEVEDRAGNISQDFLLDVEVDASIDGDTEFVLLFSSDSGMDDRDSVTNINQPTFTGLAEVGAEVTLLANGEIVGRTTVAPDPDTPSDALGEWSVTAAPLADGIYDIQVRAEDWAGNILTSETIQIEVDTLAPNTPFLDLDITSDDGVSGTDNITSRNDLLFNMTTTDPGRPAHLIDANYKFRLYQRTGTENETLVYSSFDELGDFTTLEALQTTLEDLPNGAYNFKLEVEDRAGNISPDALLDVVIGEVVVDPDVQVPTTIELVAASDAGMDPTDGVTRINAPTFAGLGEANGIVQLFANGQLVGTGRVGGDLTDGVEGDGVGLWQVTSGELDDGAYTVLAVVEDEAGNLTGSETVQIEIDTLAPNTPYLDLLPADDTGLSDQDNVTSNLRPTFHMATIDPNEDSHISPFNYKYRLFVRLDSGIERLVYDSATDDTFPGSVVDGGFTSLENLRRQIDLGVPDGVHDFKLEVEDRAGNISEDFLLGVTVDTVLDAPDTGLMVDMLSSSDTGMSARDDVTNINQPAFSGIAEVGAVVTILANGQVVGVGTVGSDETDLVPGNGLGAWEVTVEPLADGTYSVLAHIEDLAGNFGRPEPISIEIDTTAPNTPFLDLLNDTGHSTSDNITQDSELRFNLTTEDPDLPGGRANEFNYKFRIYQRLEGGAESLIYNSVTDSTIDAASISEGFTNLEQLEVVLSSFPNGVHNFKLEVEDRAGNISQDFLLDVEVDTSIDGNTDFALLFSSDSGMDDRDNVTNINQPTFAGLAEVGAEVTLLANGDIVGTSTVAPDPDTPSDALGEWSVTAAPLADGIYDIQVRVEDWAGNILTTDTIQIEVDTVEPNTPFLDLDITSDDGVSGTDNITSRNDLLFNMTTTDPGRPTHLLDANFKFRLYQRTGDETEILVYNSFDELGDFTSLEALRTTIENLPDGAYNFKLEVEDRAGNISHDTLLDVIIGDNEDFPITIELVSSSDAGMDPTDGVTRISAPVFSGLGEANSVIQLFANGQLVGTGRVGGDLTDGVEGDELGLWQVTSGVLDEGVYDVVAVLEDDLGNITTSESVQIEIDTLPPNTPYLDLLPADDTGLSNQDDVTSNLQPTFHMATIDPNKELHLDPFNYKYRLFVRLDSGIERLVYNSAEDDSFPRSVAQGGFTSLENLRRQIDLGVPDGVHDFKLEVEDRAGNISEDFLLGVTVDTVLDAPEDSGLTIDLLDSSDTGMSAADDVTRINQPAFSGVAEVGAMVTILANGRVVGVGTVGSDETDLVPGDGLGAWEVTVEPLADGTYEVLAHVEDLAGNFGRPDPISVEIDTTPPNTPLLDLLNDSGRVGEDELTQDSSLTFNLTTEDPDLPGGRASEFNLKYRIYLRPDGGEERLIYNSVTDADIDPALLSGGFTSLGQLEAVLGPFPDGVHNFKLEVEDRAGNISEDFLLNVHIDSTLDTPNGVVNIDLTSSSDTGMSERDDVTRINRPTFTGVAEVGATVNIFANGQLVGVGIVQSDETDFVPGDGLGVWQVQVDALDDGPYEVLAHIEDAAGNFLRSESLTVEIDTTQPNTPILDLLNDTGHGTHDEITGSSELLFNMTTEDPDLPGDRGSDFNYKYRVYLRPEGGGEVLVFNSVSDASVPPENLIGGFTNLEQLQETLGPFPDGIHNFKLEVEDRAGNISEDFLLTVQIDTDLLGTPDIDLITTSDSGMSATDNVTAINQPAFSGISEAGSTVRLFAGGVLIGETEVHSDESDGNVGDGLGLWEITSEPLVDGVHQIEAEVEDWAGNIERSTALEIEVDTRPPNTPFLDLTSPTDAGIGGGDEMTNVSELSFTMTTTDDSPEPHLIPQNLKFRLYLRPEGGSESLIYDSAVDGSIPPEAIMDGLVNLNFLTTTLDALPEGEHNFKLEVEDRAGNISEDFLLNVTIDTTLELPTIDLIGSSDSGMSNSDNVTSISQPTFWGLGDVGDRVTLFANGLPVGTGVVGSDQTDFIPDNGRGTWIVKIDPLTDGVHDILAQFEDEAGNFLQTDSFQIEIDTREPNTPRLDLVTESDTGHSNHDNITGDTTPTFTFTTEDPDQAGHLNEFNYKYRLFLRPEGGEEILIYNSVTDAELTLEGGFTNLEFLERTIGPLVDGIHSVKLEVEDRAGNISHDVVLEFEIDSELPSMGLLDLLASSDTGMSDNDNVTGKDQPAFVGIGTPGTQVRLFADGQFVGTAEVGSDESDGNPGNGFGIWEITSEPLDDGVYNFTATFEDWAGNIQTSALLTAEIDTIAPNTPFLDLLEPLDSGRNNDDNITNANTLTFTGTTHDSNPDNHTVLFPGGENFKYRLYVRPESGTETLVYDSVTDTSLADIQLGGFVSLSQITASVPDLPEGLHNFKLEVEDRAGNISEDFLMSVLIDRTGFKGTVEVAQGSDTGVWGIDSTFGDGITGDAENPPVLTGTAEANSVVTLLVDGQVVGSTVVGPFDGDEAFQNGTWQLSPGIDFSGATDIVVVFEDPAGNQTECALDAGGIGFVIDTTGPQILNVTQNDTDVSVFDPKPTGGPDDLVTSIVVHFTDGPDRPASTPYAAVVEELALEEGNYRLVGDANGNIPITNVRIVTDDRGPGEPLTAVELEFGVPLPDDRYTFTVFDRILDAAGNPLDGESGANGPFAGNPGLNATAPIFPTGDGNHGADFIARFTVDSRPEIGVWSAGSVYLDINGNFVWDPTNVDYVNRDFTFTTGFTSDDVFAGNFAGFNGVADGYDKVAVYGRYGAWVGGTFRWLVDLNNDGVIDIDVEDPADINGLPVAGNFDPATDGDQVGLFTGDTWHFDTDGDYLVDTSLASELQGYPIVGDFDGDSFDDLATWGDDMFMIDFANGTQNGWDGVADASFRYGFIGVRERPVAADMDQDGIDDLGLWVPDRGAGRLRGSLASGTSWFRAAVRS